MTSEIKLDVSMYILYVELLRLLKVFALSHIYFPSIVHTYKSLQLFYLESNYF